MKVTIKKIIQLFIQLFCFILCVQSQQSKHVILISIDGFRPEMYQDNLWPAPNLRHLMKEGTYAKHMKSVFPAYTYPSHTAMMTGALPARSKIYFNQPIGSTGEWNWFTKAIKVPTLWQVLKSDGMTTAAVEWPVSVTKDITYDIPEIWDTQHPEDRITEARKYATPELIDSVEKYATGKLDSNTMSEEYLSLDEQAGRAAAYIFKTHKPSFMAVHFACVDGMQHGYGRDHDSVKLALESNDRAIGEILEAVEKSGLKDSTTIIVVGDHGFSNINTVFRVNMLMHDIPVEFIAAGGSAFLYRYDNTYAEDVPNMIRAVTRRLDSLPTDKRKLFRIVDRKELDKMGADSFAIMALAAVPGLVFSGATGNNKTINNGPGTSIQQNPLEGVFVPTHGGHHGYDPNIPDMWTGFIAAGAGINKGSVIPEITVTDIAPLIAKLLGVEFKTPDGKLVEGIIRNE